MLCIPGIKSWAMRWLLSNLENDTRMKYMNFKYLQCILWTREDLINVLSKVYWI